MLVIWIIHAFIISFHKSKKKQLNQLLVNMHSLKHPKTYEQLIYHQLLVIYSSVASAKLTENKVAKWQHCNNKKLKRYVSYISVKR